MWLWKAIWCVKPLSALCGTKQAERAVGVARAACFEPLARRIRQRWCLSLVCLVPVRCHSTRSLYYPSHSISSQHPSWYLSRYLSRYHSRYPSESLPRFLMDPSGTHFDMPTWITINKSAYFLIVTLQNPCLNVFRQKIDFTIKKMAVFLIVTVWT